MASNLEISTTPTSPQQTFAEKPEPDPTPSRPFGRKKTEPHWESKKGIIKEYNDHHTRSDRELLENWNENLNSLLTFVCPHNSN